MNKVALVTGASRGIGAATAKLLAAQGYKVAVNYRASHDKATQVVDAITQAGGKAVAVQADMGVAADIMRLFAIVDDALGTVAALVNNAATYTSGTVENMTDENIERMFRINTLGVFTACREAATRMKRTGGGAIVNVSSEVTRFGGTEMSHYAASKAAINSFSVGFAREVAADNIRVNVVSPGVTDTDAFSNLTPERLSALKACLPMGRMGEPEEVAQTIAWLLSDAASYVSGSVLTVAGAR